MCIILALTHNIVDLLHTGSTLQDLVTPPVPLGAAVDESHTARLVAELANWEEEFHVPLALIAEHCRIGWS